MFSGQCVDHKDCGDIFAFSSGFGNVCANKYVRGFVDHRALPAQETQEELGQFFIAKLIVEMLFKREK